MESAYFKGFKDVSAHFCRKIKMSLRKFVLKPI